MIIEAILKINPNAEVTVNADDINQITWHKGTTPIPLADIEAKMVEVQAEYDANQYQRDNEPEQSDYAQARKNSYPEIGDQLDMLWHTMDKDNELQHKFYDFYQTIKKVKVAYPKK
tara:strand:+ start:204 stop:551 length:348 start_codon:yes stop_codon:yes gene_type:complete